MAPPSDQLIDPSLLEGLTEEERREALAAAAAARRAEERAEQRALERAVERRRQERLLLRQQEEEEEERRRQGLGPEADGGPGRDGTTRDGGGGNGLPLTPAMAMRLGTARTTNGGGSRGVPSVNPGIKFVPSKKRKADHQQVEGSEGNDGDETMSDRNGAAIHWGGDRGKDAVAASAPTATSAAPNSGPKSATTAWTSSKATATTSSSAAANAPTSSSSTSWTEQERLAVRKTYLGTSAAVVLSDAEYLQQQQAEQQRKKKKSKLGKKAMFRFEWDDTDDTLHVDDPLYAGAGVAGVHQRGLASEQRNSTSRAGLGGGRSQQQQQRHVTSRGAAARDVGLANKPLELMTARDWRIFRENYEIVVKGGRAPPPLRSFTDGNLLHPDLLRALTTVMKYREPSPIQRQAIPIGLQRRDMIGIAETGSGKTAAFGIPLLQYILQLPVEIQQRVADHGPLAMVVAPTRELALQIHGEMEKLLHYRPDLTCCAIVGGQNLQQQAQRLRKGVHVIVGTPGRLNECLDMAYMVLNQCLYIVFDEGDRMIDSTLSFVCKINSCVWPRALRWL
jgi:hypothetical protein